MSARSRLPGGSALPAAGAGIVAGAVGIAVGELVAGLIPGAPSLVIAVSSVVIALQPPGAKDVVASIFGTNDKTALLPASVVDSASGGTQSPSPGALAPARW